MHPVFSIAVYQRPTHRAFGLDLQPLSLGHLFLLREYHSKILRGAKDTGIGDVLLAAFICAERHDKSRKHLCSGWRLDRFISKWARVSRKLNLVEEVRKFFAYFHESVSCPSIVSAGKSDGNSHPIESPDEWCTLAMLMADFHMSRTDAMDAGYAWANAMWAANGERTGRHRIGGGIDAAWEAQHAIDLANLEAQKREVSCSA